MVFTSYSQNLEDVIIWRALKHVGAGFYIDIGAWSPDVDSVTRAFYERGWSGINVEPDPKWHEALTKARPRDINLRVAISAEDGEMPFYILSNPGLSTLDPEVKAMHLANGLTEQTIQTRTARLETLWREHAAGREVHFLKIDVEGLEKQVIDSNDWKTCRPWLVIVEATRPMSPEENHMVWEPALASADYAFAYADGLNRYYVAKEHGELLASFRYPPNVFDNYRPSLIGDLEAELAESKGREIGAQQIAEANGAEARALEKLAQEAQSLANDNAVRAQSAEEQLAARTAELNIILNSRTWRLRNRLVGIAKTLLGRSSGPAQKKSSELTAPRILRHITVDLTPMLPGGANGGAKIFILELLRELAARQPDVRFSLLTRAESHRELAFLDAPNMTRHLTLGTLDDAGKPVPQAPPFREKLFWKLRQISERLQGRIPWPVPGVFYRLAGILGTPPQIALAKTGGMPIGDLLFCPFTAPIYAAPGLPVVSTLYDLQYISYPEFFQPEDVAHRHQTFLDACRWATVITPISEYSRERAIEVGKLAEDRLRTIHIRTAHRMAEASAERQTALMERLGLKRGRYVLYPANFWRHKNHEILLIAFAMARAEGLPEDVRLVCSGVHSERGEWLSSELGRLGLKDRVMMPGFVPTEDLASLLGNAVGLVFPSLYEGFGMPVIEAFAVGIPVACSNTTSLPEIAGDAARLFDPRVPSDIAAAIRWLASDEPHRDGFVDRGRAIAAGLADTGRMTEEYWDAISDAYRRGPLLPALV